MLPKKATDVTLFIFSKELMFLDDLQYYAEMTNVIILTLIIHQDIVNGHNYKGTKAILEHSIQGP